MPWGSTGFAQKRRGSVNSVTMRKAGKQEEAEFDPSCFPAFLIVILDLSFCTKPDKPHGSP
jgi:hypothetical protein